jgi:hypothetical protein
MRPQLLAADFEREAGVARYVYRIEVANFEKVPTEDGKGTVSRPLPPTLEEVTVTIDVRTIAQSLGVSAVRNKGGKSTDGFVTVTHRRPKKR